MTEQELDVLKDVVREMENVVAYGSLPEATRERLRGLIEEADYILRYKPIPRGA